MSFQLSEINYKTVTDPKGFVQECDAVYHKKVEQAALKILENQKISPIVLLSGPSGSGKTTTAMKIAEALEKHGVITHYVAMTAVQNHDPDMWDLAAGKFGDDFEAMYLMMNHGLFTELRRGKMCDNRVLYRGVYDSQLMAAAGTDEVPTVDQLIASIREKLMPLPDETVVYPGHGPLSSIGYERKHNIFLR